MIILWLLKKWQSLSYNVNIEDVGLRDYEELWNYQAEIFRNLIERKTASGKGQEKDPEESAGTLIFVEHPHVYTLGKNGSDNNLLLDLIQLRAKEARFYRTDRGGDITYHGPGQIVGYPIFDLERLNIGLKEYIHRLEEAVIRTVADFNLTASRLEGGTGVWLEPGIRGRERKICAIGVRASKYVTMHGFAFNVNTDLAYFDYINPCGFKDKGVSSLEKELGSRQDMDIVKGILKRQLQALFDISWTNIKR